MPPDRSRAAGSWTSDRSSHTTGATVPEVELVRVGNFQAGTGPLTITADDLAAILEASEAPGIRRAVVRLGHYDPRFDGEPALGRVSNLRLSENGNSLVGDLVGVPSWLAERMSDAYPDRSVEISPAVDRAGRKHRWALTGLALLGVASPAIPELRRLDDLPTLIAASAAHTETLHLPAASRWVR